VKKEAIYLSVNLVTHYLLQIILTRWRWSDVMMMKSDKKDENFYLTIKYNLTWLKEKLFTLSLLKMKSEKSLSVNIETMIHYLHDMMHQNLKMTWNWVHHVIMLLFKAMLAVASMLDENTACVNYHCAQRWMQQQHQIIWSVQFIMHQHYLKHAKINKSIRNHEFSHQRRRCKKSRDSKSDDHVRKVKKNKHLNEEDRLCEYVNMISVSAEQLLIMMMMMKLILLCHSC